MKLCYFINEPILQLTESGLGGQNGQIVMLHVVFERKSELETARSHNTMANLVKGLQQTTLTAVHNLAQVSVET